VTQHPIDIDALGTVTSTKSICSFPVSDGLPLRWDWAGRRNTPTVINADCLTVSMLILRVTCNPRSIRDQTSLELQGGEGILVGRGTQLERSSPARLRTDRYYITERRSDIDNYSLQSMVAVQISKISNFKVIDSIFISTRRPGLRLFRQSPHVIRACSSTSTVSLATPKTSYT
jgi:hypothetical protein